MPPAFIHALGFVKMVGGRSTGNSGLLDRALRTRSSRPQRSAEGKWDAEFPIDVFQTGSGTSTNMNANEVIAPRSAQIAGQDRVTPTIHVNLGQSSNDVIPTVLHLSAAMTIASAAARARASRGLAGQKAARVRRIDQDRAHASHGRDAASGSARSSAATLAGASTDRADRRRVCPTCASWRSAAPRSAPGSTRIPSSRGAWRRPATRKLPFRRGPQSLRGAGRAGRRAVGERRGSTRGGQPDEDRQRRPAHEQRPRCGLGEIALPAIQPARASCRAR
jgi:fumarate hydratase class II